MSTKQTENLHKQKRQLLTWIAEIDRTIHEIALSGTSSASLSSSGGSKTYTRLNLSELRTLRIEYMRRLNAVNRAVLGIRSIPARRILTVRY